MTVLQSIRKTLNAYLIPKNDYWLLNWKTIFAEGSFLIIFKFSILWISFLYAQLLFSFPQISHSFFHDHIKWSCIRADNWDKRFLKENLHLQSAATIYWLERLSRFFAGSSYSRISSTERFLPTSDINKNFKMYYHLSYFCWKNKILKQKIDFNVVVIYMRWKKIYYSRWMYNLVYRLWM